MTRRLVASFSPRGQAPFYDCGLVNIGDLGWSDKIRSYVNAQSRGTVSIFMNWTGSTWQELRRSTAKEAYDRAPFVNATDGIWVC